MTSRRPRLLARLLAAVLAAAVAAPVTATSASAAVPVPQVRDLGAAIDPLASYTAETGCEPDAKPGPEAVVRLIEATYGDQATNIPRPCSGSDSGHEEGRSIDWMLDVRRSAQKARAEAFLDWLQATDGHGNTYAMARRLGIMYVIWNGRMWRAYDPTRGGGNGWTEYSGCLTSRTATRYDTTCHRDHIHLSFSWEGAAALTSYYTGRALPGRCATGWTSSAPALPTSGLGFVPVTQRRVVNTSTGLGLGSPCRLSAGQRVDAQVTGRGGVPSSGVAAVALAVSVRRATRGTTVTAYPAGASATSAQTVTAPWRTTRGAATVVPVGAGGKVSFQISNGTAEISADVLGYHPTSGGSGYRAAAQVKVLDVTVPARGTRTVTVGGKAGIPASGVEAAAVSVTAVSPTAGGGIGAWSAAAGAPRPGVPAAVVTAGRTRTSRVVVPTTGAGRFVLENRTAKPLRTRVHTVGWFAAGLGRFTPLAGTRVVNTRTGKGISGALTEGRTATVSLTGGAVPSDAKAAVLQVSAVAPTRDTRLTVWGAGTARPGAPALLPRAGESESQLVLAPIGAGGEVAFYNRSGATHVVANLLGYTR